MKILLFRILAAAFSVVLLGGGAASAAEDEGAKAKKPAVVKSGSAPSKKATGAKSTSKKVTPAKKAAPKGKTKKRVKPAAVVKPPEVKLPAVVKELRFWSNPDYTRIAVTLDREATFESHRLLQEQDASITGRLYLDISGAKLSSEVKDLAVGDGLLKTARIAQFRPDTVRVVLDLESIKDFKIFTFSDPFRIMIDVRGARRTEISSLKEKIEPAPAVPATVRDQVVEKLHPKPLQPLVSRIRRIVVDPGHGGHDPGAVGAEGTKEKDVVLSIGLKLAKKLKEENGLDVIMTRSTDVFLELQERTAIANQVGADLFLSIHANAAPNKGASGIETYYLSLAKTEKAAQLAAKENGTSLEKVSMLQAVLFDLMANYKINDSAHLAEVVQKELHRNVDARWPVKSLGVKQGPFYVLVGATMPSILVETAFLSNEKEEQRLKDQQFHEVTAEGIANGVRSYISSLK